MSLYPPPEIVEAEIWTTLPDAHRVPGTSPAWAAANKPGRRIDSFLEGPCFDTDGTLWVTDIPYGRVFAISPTGDWRLVAEYDGWPNGLKIDADGRILIADYKRGIVELDPVRGTVAEVVAHRHSERFRGCNDLTLDGRGALYFTDQGQSGMHRADGRVYRYDLRADRLDLLLETGPSPNGIVLNDAGDALYVAMTRGNSVWRLPLMADGTVSKAGVFVQVSGGLSGPDGLARDAEGGLWIAHAGNGCVWGMSRLGHPLWRVVSRSGLTTTNIAFGGEGGRDLFVTESDTGHILRARLPVAGAPLGAGLPARAGHG